MGTAGPAEKWSPMLICTLCNKFQGRWRIDSRSESEKHRGHGHRNFMGPKFAWADLVQSAESCYCCDIIVNGCRGCFEIHNVAEEEIVAGKVEFFYPNYIEDAEEEGAGSNQNVIFEKRDGGRFEVEIFATEDEDCPVPDAWDYVAISQRTTSATDSDAALEKIQEWVSDCLADSLCKSPESPKLPTRVIQVGKNNDSVRLVEPKGLYGPYICLSHCWGLEQIITTTTATLKDRLKGIAWPELSKTFQDAITLTRTLGFEYIWIDSMCIIQDSAEDWNIESSRMASVYSNGHLTIAATRSPNGRGGLFGPTKDFRMAGITPDGEEYCLFFRERIDHQIDRNLETAGYTATETYYPLLSRAWVYQERMLSTRVLHFGRYEMFFECNSGIDCECGSIGFHGNGTETPVPLVKVEYADALADYELGYKGAIYREMRYHGARLWRTMVYCYTALLLTKSKDRLPAIGGLARQMSSKRKDRYLAGLWEESLNEDLLWEAYMPSKFKNPRPYPRNAPTWSWASVETIAGYWNVIIFTGLNSGDNSFEQAPPHEHFSVVENCEVTTAAVDEFGTIAGGRLTITGLVVEGTLQHEVKNGKEEGTVAHCIAFGDKRLQMDPDYLLDHDGPGQTHPGTAVICLRMSLFAQGMGKERLMSLVLKSSPEHPETFERIGTLSEVGLTGTIGPYGGHYEGARSRTVVII